MNLLTVNNTYERVLKTETKFNLFTSQKARPLVYILLFSLVFLQPAFTAEYLAGTVWHDTNANGIQDGGETGVAGVTVTITGVSVSYSGTKTTDANGDWISNDLRSRKTYNLNFSNFPAGYALSPQDQGGDDNLDSDPNTGTGTTIAYTVVRNQTVGGIDAGIYLPAEMDVQGNGTSILDGDASPTATDHTDFGDVAAGAATNSHTFTIYATGGLDLLLSGSPIVTISGTHAADYSVTTQPTSPIVTGNNDTFVIQFSPSTTGLRMATISIDNNDPDENPYTFDIQGTGTIPPEIDISGNGTTIYDGDTSPSVTDDTYFGSADIVTGYVDHTFTVSNSAVTTLNLSGSPIVQLSGAHAADFSVTTPPASTIAPSGSDTFVIRFDPSTSGNRTATVTIENDDLDENPYTFDIQGTGSVTPEMDITGNGVSIVDGTTTTSTSDHTDFDDTDVNNGGMTIRTFTISNSGSGDLTLSGPTYVNVSGAHASDFTVSQQPASATVSALGGSQTFQITFDPPTTGLRQASVSITNDDPDESPYTFAIQGTGILTPEIDILNTGVSIVDGDVTPSISDSTDFDHALVGGNTHIVTYTIENNGLAPLNLTGSWPLISISGSHAGDFSVVTAPSTPIAQGGSTTFQIAFDPLTTGIRAASLTIANNDLDEGGYTFAIQGTGLSGGATLCEIDVQGNLVSIASGDVSPSVIDGTAFGSLAHTAGTTSQTFMVRNTGSEDLILTSSPLVSITGTHASDFSVTLQPSSHVAPAGSVPFNVTFDPSAPGARTAVISIENNDGDENPYTFEVEGFGLSYPEIEVRGNNNIIYSGSVTPGNSDSTDFGDVTPWFGDKYITYTIYNTGDSALALSGNPRVEIAGDASSEFVVTTQPSATILPGGSSDFVVKFDPGVVGTRNAYVSILNSDSNESPYTFYMTGEGKGNLTPFPCISRFFHIYGDDGVISYMDATVNPYAYTTMTQMNYSINGVGYNVEDGLLYGFEMDNDVPGDNIVRIDGDYNVDVLNVSINYESWRADFDVSGDMYFWNSSGTEVGIFDASAGTVTYHTTTGATWIPIDMAYLDADGKFYGMHGDYLYQYDPNNNHYVVEIPITGRLADDYLNNINSAYYGAAWSADDGYIFTTNSQSGRMYKISPSGFSIYVGLGQANLNKSDGASCPLVPAPLPSTGQVGDKVWVDSNADGIQDAGEPGLPGVVVDLYSIDSPFIASAITDANGEYLFQNLSPSEYYIVFSSAPAGFTLTQQHQGLDGSSDSDANTHQDSLGRTPNFFVGVGLIEEGIDAGYTAAGVGDFIWDDLNSNDDQDFGEPGIPGVTVELVLESNGSTIDATTSDANGSYSFSNVSADDYRIRVTNLPGGYQFVNQNSGATDDVDSDINPATGLSDIFTINNDYNSSIDAGIEQNSFPEMNVVGNGNSISDGDTSPSTTDDTDFGSLSAVSGSVVHTFTIDNATGSADLTLNGSPVVEISGTNAADFTLTTAPALTTLTTAQTTTFQITFDPIDNGLRTAVLSISNNDANENPYDFDIQGTGLAPEIAILGNGQNITTGDTIPSLTDATDFGSHDIDTGSSNSVFTIQNTGPADLDLNGGTLVVIGGDHPGDFTVTANPTTPVAATSGSTTFTVNFNPTTTGLREATISVASTDSDENPFVFTIHGTGTSSPEIAVQGNLNDIPHGDTTPSTTDLTDFGGRDVADPPLAYSFTIQNVGSGDLALTGLPIVQITGANAGDFIVSQQPASSTITPAGSITFQVSFDPTTTGIREATVLIPNDDADEAPFSYAIQGLGTSTLDEEIEVLGNDQVIDSGDNFPTSADFTDMGTAEISGVPATATFVVRNIGYAVLSLTGPPPYVSFTGTNASEFTITSTPSNSIAIDSATTTFEVTFTPFALGTRQAIVNIQNDDADEDPYTFTIQGTGVYDPTSLSEINIKGNMIDIADGDTSPNVSDGTDYGSVEVIGGFTTTQEYVIYNNGSDDLALGDNPIISTVGAHASDFSVIAAPASLVAPSSTVAFTIEFNPSASGLREATISIGNSDLDEDPYTFDIQGTGTITPEMTVTGNSVTIANGDTSPSLTDSTLFGDVDITTGSQFITYTINNSGNTSLTVGAISFSGAHASDFSVSTAPAASVSTSGSTTFVVKFDPSSVGTRTATISIVNDDPDVSPYEFDLQGNGTSPSDGVIGNMVWLDNNGDGIQDAGEDALSGVTVTLYDSGDNSMGSTVSGSDGSYSFTGLAAGDYYLTFTNPPNGFVLSAMDQGGDDALDSDADPSANGKTATFTLGISEIDNTRDAGFKATGVGDIVWLDVNTNGLQDGGEAGVSGIDVEIKIDGGASIATTTTDVNGYYAFTGLTPQTYRLYFTGLPAGYAFATQNVGGDDTIDSDVNLSTGESDAVIVGADVFVSSLDAGVYQQSEPEISVKGNNIDIVDGDASPSTLDFTDFGDVDAQIDSVIHTFQIFNGNGAADLTLNGTPKVTISGANAAEFFVKVEPAEVIIANSSTSFDIRFIPLSEGTKTATVSITNTDSDENPYTFDIRGNGLASEIEVKGNNTVISDGDITPTATDFTDFGSEDILTGSQAQIFTILNTGNADLKLSNPATYIDISGAHAADFTVTSVPTTPIATNNSTSFTITFDPSAEGLREAVISIDNNDLDEDPYTFAIQGIGLASPEISVLGNGESIADGDASPIVTDNTDFGSKDILTATQENSFYLKNIGSGALTLNGVPLVALSGAHAGDFLVSTPPAVSSIAPGDSVIFSVTFNPTVVGLRSATLSVANDDDDENPFNFDIQGTGIASSDINVLGNGVSISSGDITPDAADSTLFMDTILDSTSWVTYTIENTGSAVLNLTGGSPFVTISGTHASDFTLGLIPQATINAGGGTTSFTISFTPGAEGVRTASISIASDDSDENPYTFSISGTSLPMPLPDLFLSESVDLSTALPGDTLTYTVTYSNVGEGVAKNVVVDQAIPNNSTYVENSAAGAGMIITYQHEVAGGYDSSQAAPVVDIKYERTLDLEPTGIGTITFKVVID